MAEKKWKQPLRAAMERAAPDDRERLLAACGPQERKELFMNESAREFSQPRRRWLPAAAAALAVVLAFCGGFGLRGWQSDQAVASVVSLDVNPSIQLQVNQKERVLSAQPLNQDAQAILAGMELEGTQLTVAVNAIVGALLQHGYLNQLSSAILISVEDQDLQRAGRLEAALTQSVNAVLENASAGAAVLSQVLTRDAGLEAQAQASQISQGKAALVREVQALNQQLDFDALAALSVEELEQLRRTGAPEMPIGAAAAAYAAETYAGTLAVDSITWEADPELDETPPHYEIELRHPVLGKFDYHVDAYTGEVLSGLPGIFSDGAPSGQEPAGSTPPDPSAAPERLPAAPETAPGTSSLPAAPETPAAAPGAAYIGESAAKEAALRHAGVAEADTIYCQVWMDYDDGRPDRYEVEFLTETAQYEYEIGLRDGAVLECSQETHHRSPGHGDAAGCITMEEAKNAACRHAGADAASVRWEDCELDWEDGRYEVEFRWGQREYEYEIDAYTGAVLQSEWDWED